MYDYAGLPTLVLNLIFGYLSVKQRVRCKGVCSAWKNEIELREQMSDTLVLHLGPYPWNIRWTETNNHGLMKFENSFEVNNLDFLEHPLTKTLLAKTEKLAIVDYYLDVWNRTALSIQPYLSYFDKCEEIEIRGLRLEGRLTFDLPKLKVLAIRDNPELNLVLKCPALEVLFWNGDVKEINFEDTNKLKRLICNGWHETIWTKGKFSSLEYLSLLTARDEPVNDHLLNRMPKLKRFVLYSNNLDADLEIIREQQKRFGLKNLEVLFNGFRDPVEIGLDPNEGKFLIADSWVEKLHENYSKLVENLPWKVCIEYSTLFRKFKILPGDFFERFSEPCTIVITEVTSYNHLLGFLKCYCFIEHLVIYFSNVKAYRVLDLMYSLQPSLTELTILEDRSSDVLKIDLSFMALFNLIFLHFKSTRLPVEFIRRVAARRGPHFVGFSFQKLTTGHQMLIHFSSDSIVFYDVTCGSETAAFPYVERLIIYLQSDRHLREFLL